MSIARWLTRPLAILPLAMILLGSANADAGRYSDLYSISIWLSCENGRTYPIWARAVSVEGEIVTGYLVTAPRRAVYVRLIPMGMGYRYAGRGIWLDGIRSDAVLHFGKHSSVACTVVQEQFRS